MRVPTYNVNNQGNYWTITPVFRVCYIDISRYAVYEGDSYHFVTRIGNLDRTEAAVKNWYAGYEANDPDLDLGRILDFIESLKEKQGYYIFKIKYEHRSDVLGYWRYNNEKAPKVFDFSNPDHFYKYLENGFWNIFELGEVVFHIPLMNSLTAYGKITDFIQAQQQTLTVRDHDNDTIGSRRRR